MSREGKEVYLSISTLEKEFGDDLEYTRIKYSSDEDGEYFDLYNADDELCCMDGENVRIVKDDGTDLTFVNQNGLKDVEFRLTLTEFKTAYFN